MQICIVIRKRERRFLKGSCNKRNKGRKKGKEEEIKKKEREKKERDRKKVRNKDESEE